jgi:hypothetical protein
MFAYQKFQFGHILEGLGMENVAIFLANGNNCRQFHIVYDLMVYFVVVWYIFPVKVCFTKKNLSSLSMSTYVLPIILFLGT